MQRIESTFKGQIIACLAYTMALLVTAAFAPATRAFPDSPCTNWIQTPYIAERQGQAMAYDTNRGVITLFGGSGYITTDETWEWNGLRWNPRTPAIHPTARNGHAMVYDA